MLAHHDVGGVPAPLPCGAVPVFLEAVMVRPKGVPNPAVMLMDFRHVYKNPETEDQPRHAPARALLKSSPARFIEQLLELESQHKAKKAAAKPGSGVIDDEGAALVGELVSKLLRQFVGKKGAEADA